MNKQVRHGSVSVKRCRCEGKAKNRPPPAMCMMREGKKGDANEDVKCMNSRTVRHSPSAKPSVRETGDVVTQTGAHDQTRGLEHLRHA